MTQAELNTTLTPDEERLGYGTVWIENDRNRFGGSPFEPHLLEAVAYKVSESIWVFKINRPQAMVAGFDIPRCNTERLESPSMLRRHGVRGGEATADPAAAIEASKRPPHRELQPAIPPLVEGIESDRRILYMGDQVSPADVQKHGGKPAKRADEIGSSFR